MLEVVLAIGAFLGILLMGAGALSMGSGERRWRPPAKADAHGHGLATRAGPAFRPLQMDPFTLKWPSEVPHRRTAIAELPWPSETWDDEYFGTRSRDDVRRISATADALDAKRARTTQQAQRRQAGVPEPGPEPAREAPAPKKPKKQRKKDLREESARRAGAVVEAAVAGGREAGRQAAQEQLAEVAEEFFREAIPDPPTAEEITALVQTYGLQTGIEHIRQRTGWDFKTATEHLAKALREQR